MNVSLSWLTEFVEISLPLAELETLLTRTGLKVESMKTCGIETPKVVVAQILSSEQHPNADRLSVCQVDDGSGTPRQIVCGAKNYKPGDKVPLALPGAALPGDFVIKSGKLRGVVSEGMMCSGKELGLSPDAEGLLILPETAPVGTSFSELYPPETVIELEITPNRPDWLSHLGVAREISAFTNQPCNFTKPHPTPTREDEASANIEKGAACPFYSLRRIRNVRVAPSPEWLCRRLESIGLRPINNVVDITNYVLFELGQPLHAFDAAKINGGIVVRNATKDETFEALDDKTYQLSFSDTVIADSKSTLALGGVMGGKSSGVTDSTTEILLESALFHPQTIRKTSRSLGLQSDSSYRFERGVDPSLVLAASARACALIEQLTGGVCDPETIIAGALPSIQKPVSLRHTRCRALLGTKIPDEKIVSLLSRLGFTQTDSPEGDGSHSTWQPPAFRSDVTREVDLIEEVIRLEGIEQVPAKLGGTGQGRLLHDSRYDAIDQLREKLISAGFFEARLSALVAEADLGCDAPNSLRLKNPLGTDQAYLRPSLRSGLLNAAKRNFHHGAEEVRLFEVGNVFSSGDPEQSTNLAVLASGGFQPRSWQSKNSQPFSFFDLKGLLEMLLPGSVSFLPFQAEGFVLAAQVFLKGEAAGLAGILSPTVSRNLAAPNDVVVAEIRIDSILNGAQKTQAPTLDIPKFPSTSRDLAIVVPAETPFSQIEEILHSSKEPLLTGTAPFDLFRDPSGAKLETDKKSIAVSLTFQSADRTLTSNEVDAATDRIKSHLRKSLGAEFRE